MGDDITIEEQALEFSVAPPAMEGDAVERRQSVGIARAGFRQHGLAREQAADDPYHRRGRRAASCGCASGARRESGLGGAWSSAAAAPSRAIQSISGAPRCSTDSGGSAPLGQAAATLFAAEPMMRAGAVIAARAASRTLAIRGATSVRPPVPNTCK